MFGMSGTEMIIILVLALMLFGPDKLPEMAKMLGKGMREFQKATGDIRSTVESEFNKLADLDAPLPPSPRPVQPNVIKLEPPTGSIASNEPANSIAPPAVLAASEPSAEPKAEPSSAPAAPEKERS